jgi:hypothetical protein
MKKSPIITATQIAKHTAFQKAFDSNYGKKYFNAKVKVKSPDDLLGKNVEPPPKYTEPPKLKDKGTVPADWTYKKFDDWTDMSIYYNNSSSTSAYVYGSSTGNYVYHPYFINNHKPTIGETPVTPLPDSLDKTFSHYQEELDKENHILHSLVKKQAQKLKQEYMHEHIEFQKKMELEQQKEDMPIYSAEFGTARVFLQYYANLSLQKPPPQLKPEQIMSVSKYLAATISCELRHRKRKCVHFWSRGLYLWDMLDDWNIDDNKNRRDAGKRFLSESEDWDNFMVEQYLKLGAYIFGGSWEGGFGGWPWASVAWYAGDWVYSALTKKGIIPVMLWEKMLNAAHNNGRWMNKLGMGNVMGVLNMGANADPSFIAGIAKKALIVDNPNDFKRIIEKWTSCDLPGEKCKLELPNPGVAVEVSRYRSSKKSYLVVIKKQEADLKAKEAPAKLVLEAPDETPIEMGVSEEAVEVKLDSSTAKNSYMSAEVHKQLSEQSKMMSESLSSSISATAKKKLEAALEKKLVIPKSDASVLLAGIKIPWKGSSNPMKPPGNPGEALNKLTEAFYHAAKGKTATEKMDEGSFEVKGYPKESSKESFKEMIMKHSEKPDYDIKTIKEQLEAIVQPSGKKPSADSKFAAAEVVGEKRTPQQGGITDEQVATG